MQKLALLTDRTIVGGVQSGECVLRGMGLACGTRRGIRRRGRSGPRRRYAHATVGENENPIEKKIEFVITF